MKLLFVYKFCTLGGVEVMLRSRLEELLRRGIRTKLLFLEDFGGRPLFDLFEEHVLISSDTATIARLLEVEDFDFVMSVDTPEIRPVYQTVVTKAKFIYEVHTTYTDNLAYLLRSQNNRDLSAIIVPSEFLKLLVQVLAGSDVPVHVVPNSINRLFLTVHDGPDRNFIDKKIILWVGRLDDHKNWQDYLQLASGLISWRQDLEFWLVGGARANTTQKERLLASVKERRLIRHFRWIPQVRYEDMPALYSHVGRAGGCLVLTSRNESFGMTVLEAMACHCPVVVPLVGALGELVEDGVTGKTYPATDRGCALDAVREMLHDPQARNRMIDAAYQQTVRRFTPSHAVDQLVSVLAGLM